MQVSQFGPFKVLLDVRNYIDGRIIAFGGYETETLEAFFSQAQKMKATVFLDIGANIGIYTLKMAQNPAIKTFLAFEPDPRNRNQLGANIFLNQLDDKITVSPLALSSKSGTATFHMQRNEKDFSTGKSGFHCEDEGSMPIEITTARLDDFCPIKKQVVAMKIDVEGHELEALKGMKTFFKNNKIFLQIEVFDTQKKSVFPFLEEAGFKNITPLFLEKTSDYWFSKK